MKNTFILIVILFFTISANAQKYYISSSDPNADDQSNGSLATPWKTLGRLNALLATTTPIDTVFLKCGDVFRDSIHVSVASGFVITSYGTGNKPIISGADTVKTWTPIDDFYQASFSQTAINFFVNGKEQILARYPDQGDPYLTVDAATKFYLQDAALSSLPNISTTVLNNSQICVHTAQWCWEKNPIASSSTTQINYQDSMIRVPTAGYCYFLYDDTTYLTTGKEWKYDAAVQKMYYKPVIGNPNTLFCEASVRPYGILLGAGVSGITIFNIAFEKQAESGIAILDTTNDNIRIDNCYFARQYKYGVDVQGRNVEISNCYFREIDGLGVYIHGTGFKADKAQVHHNTFRNNGGFRNSGIGMEINLSSIKGAFVDSCHIHHNDIDSAGYCGISMDGKWNIIERNIVKNAMLLNNDGAALKSFGVGSQYSIFRNNFVSKSDGNMEGAPGNADFVTPAIYFDFSTNNCTIQENTVYDRTKKGIFLNASTNNNTVIDNVIYGGNYGIDYNGAPNPGIFPYTSMTGMTVKNNSFFAKDTAAYIMRMLDNTPGGYTHGIIDSNFYFHPYNTTKYAKIITGPDYSFSDWQTNTGYDLNSKSSFVNWTLPTADDTLVMNQTDNVVNVNLGATKYLDLDSNVVCGSITLQPYTSKILINTHTNCPTGFSEYRDRNSLAIFPNPATDEIIIRTNDKTPADYFIINIVGDLVASGPLKNGNNKVTVKHLPAGIYFMQVNCEHSQTIKMMKY